MSTSIFVRFTQEGYHRWPDGPDYLAARHRHIFHVEVSMPAPENDSRQIEFHNLIQTARRHMFKMGKLVSTDRVDFGDWSCETIAGRMAERLANWCSRQVTVTVSEDGECGATSVKWPNKMDYPSTVTVGGETRPYTPPTVPSIFQSKSPDPKSHVGHKVSIDNDGAARCLTCEVSLTF